MCEHALSHGCNPVVKAAAEARLLIIGQAPGTKVHASGVPWDDASGERLRDWLQMTPEQFYDTRHVAIMPMAFCYPGKGKSGDLPPRVECAPLWHAPIRQALPRIELTLLVGSYAQQYYLGKRHKTLTDRVANWHEYLPEFFPLVHPSPRNRLWLRRNPWFEEQVVVELRKRVAALMAAD